MKVFALLNRIPYWKLVAIPALLYMLGAASNQAVLIANGGRFPVQVTPAALKYEIGEERTRTVDGIVYLDPVHTVMRPEDHLKMLADVIDLHVATFSIGDLFLIVGDFGFAKGIVAWLALILKKLME